MNECVDDSMAAFALQLLAIPSHEVHRNCTIAITMWIQSCSNPESINLPSDEAELIPLGQHAIHMDLRF
jgi:hypothetical protein